MNPYDDLANRGHIRDRGCPCKECQKYFLTKESESSFITHSSENRLVFRHHISAKARCWLCSLDHAPETRVD